MSFNPTARRKILCTIKTKIEEASNGETQTVHVIIGIANLA